MEDTIIITKYISVWMYHLIAVLFFIETMNLIIWHKFIWVIPSTGALIVSEYLAWKRRFELENGN